MTMLRVVLTAVGALLAIGCGPGAGELGGKCLATGKCNEGLSCMSDKCVDLVAADVTGAPATASGDDGTTGDAKGGTGAAATAAESAAPAETAAPGPPRDALEVDVTPAGLAVDGRTFKPEELGAALDAARTTPATKVTLRVDHAVPYLRVTGALDALKRHGLKLIAFAEAGPATDPIPAPDPNGRLDVEVLASGVRFGGKSVTDAAFGAAVARAAAKDPKTAVALRAGPAVPYDRVIDVMSVVNEGGLTKLSFALAPAAAAGKGKHK